MTSRTAHATARPEPLIELHFSATIESDEAGEDVIDQYLDAVTICGHDVTAHLPKGVLKELETYTPEPEDYR